MAITGAWQVNWWPIYRFHFQMYKELSYSVTAYRISSNLSVSHLTTGHIQKEHVGENDQKQITNMQFIG